MMQYRNLRDVHKRRRNKAAAPVGALMLILAIVGIIALVGLGVNLTGRILDNSGEKENFEKIIEPVLMFDPPPFTDISTLPAQTVLESALWATMLGEKRDSYAFDAQNSLVVPGSDVDVTAAKLFGPELKLEHKSFSSDFGISYDYRADTKAYHVPVMSATALYTPRVDGIQRTGDVYSLLVGYIPPGTAWNTDITGAKTQPDPHKFMVYKLQKLPKHYQLIAIEDPPQDKQNGAGAAPESVGQIARVQEEPLAEDGVESAAPSDEAVDPEAGANSQGESASEESSDPDETSDTSEESSSDDASDADSESSTSE